MLEKISRFFLRCVEKRPITGKFSKLAFIATPIDVLCSNFVKFGGREIGKVVRYLANKKKQNFA